MFRSHRFRFVVALGALLIADSSALVSAAPPGEFRLVTARMSSRRASPSAVLLADGKVLVTGGEDLTPALVTRATAELFDPATETFTPTGAMQFGRIGHVSVRLQDGRVLVLGGFGNGEARTLRKTAEVYDPATGVFTAVGQMSVTRVWPSAMLLQDGRVLVVGGGVDPPFSVFNDVAELFDPATGQFLRTDSTTVARGIHAAARLLDGRVAIFGGGDVRVEVYDPAAGKFSMLGELVSSSHFWGCGAVVRADGTVVVADSNEQRAIELYDPTTGTATKLGALTHARNGATLIPLPEGRLLVAGGWDDVNDKGYKTSELIDLTTGKGTAGPTMPTVRQGAAAVALPDGRGLIVGGVNGANLLNSALLYLP